MSYELEKTSNSFQLDKQHVEDEVYKRMSSVTMIDAIEQYLQGKANVNTRRTYRNHLSQLVTCGLISPGMTLQQFAHMNTNNTLDAIKELDLSESTRQARAACFIGFTKYLARKTSGLVKNAVPNTTGDAKTFKKIRHKVTTKALTKAQRNKFFTQLGKISKRDLLIAKVILQGGKRKSEVLNAKIEDIEWKYGRIKFDQTKSNAIEDYTVITYPDAIMRELREYIGDRKEGYIFTTCDRQGNPTGKRIAPNQIDRNFAKAGERAKIKFRVTPHVLRATAVTFLARQGVAPSEIMKVTGHKTTTQVIAYDKTSMTTNVSQQFDLCK